MSFTSRQWSRSVNFPDYEVDELGAIRKVDDDYKYRIPQFWGKLDDTDPEWLVTLRDEEGRDITVPVYDVVNHIGWPVHKYEN